MAAGGVGEDNDLPDGMGMLVVLSNARVQSSCTSSRQLELTLLSDGRRNLKQPTAQPCAVRQ
jgi:hypothetical protein